MISHGGCAIPASPLPPTMPAAPAICVCIPGLAKEPEWTQDSTTYHPCELGIDGKYMEIP